MSEKRHLLFVYGSLKKGFSNHHFLWGQDFLREAVTEPVYRMYDYGGYPGIVPAETGGYSIRGELWQIDDKCLADVDYLEDIDSGLYHRGEARLAPPDHVLKGVILYHYGREVGKLPDVGGFWGPERDQRQ